MSDEATGNRVTDAAGREMTRKNVMLGTAGHVDHGKTALVKLLTGCDTDTLAEEKARGMTIELGFAPCAMADERIVGIVDVPGHVGFIRNMVAGAQGVDVVIFVVAADDGVMPQTREHLDILTLMGVRRGVIALTKVDLVDDELRQAAVEEVRAFVTGTFLADAPICPISTITGEGFSAFFEALDGAVNACAPRRLDGLFRLWVERSFSIHGFGTVVSGIPAWGSVAEGDRLIVQPSGQSVRVRKLQVYGRDASVGRAGECVAMNLADADPAALSRGAVLTADPACHPATMVEAALTVLPSVPRPLEDYVEGHIHLGTAEAMANVAMLAGEPIAPGATALVQLRLREPLAAVPGERFVLRGSVAGLAGGRVTTLGGGRILDVSDTRLRRGRPWVLGRLEARREALDDPRRWCETILREADAGLTRAELAARAHWTDAQVDAVLPPLVAGGVAIAEPGGLVIHAEALDALGDRAVEALDAFHAAEPMRAGMAPAALAAALDVSDRVGALTVERLAAARRIEGRGPLLGLPGRGVHLAEADRALADRIVGRLRDAAFEAPLPEDLAGELGIAPQRLASIVRVLADQGAVVPLDAKVTLHADAVQRARQVALDLFRQSGSFTTMQFRDALGVSRKYAVPLLDWFDTVRFTTRNGSIRRPGAEARAMLNGG
ncbi:MAG: selenocysteine-specific translation elongation factor [Planctomycetes bacterium]|nr:selenocysteine-specific translation elongation factor [Planctomycetota bacterium]